MTSSIENGCSANTLDEFLELQKASIIEVKDTNANNNYEYSNHLIQQDEFEYYLTLWDLNDDGTWDSMTLKVFEKNPQFPIFEDYSGQFLDYINDLFAYVLDIPNNQYIINSDELSLICENIMEIENMKELIGEIELNGY